METVAETTPEKADYNTAAVLPLPEKDFTSWKSRVELSEKNRKAYQQSWTDNVRAMVGETLDKEPEQDTVVVNKDWPRVKVKQADLFFQVPEVKVTAKRDDLQAVAPVYAAVINDYLCRVKTHVMMDEVLPDVLNAAGIGVSKICYDVISEDAEVPEQDLSKMEPALAQAAVASGAVKMVKTKRIIHEDYSWKRVSPGHFIWPNEFKGSDWDEAAWLGHKFRLPLAIAKERYKLPDDFKGKTTSRDEDSIGADSTETQTEGDYVVGWEIWLKAHLFDSTVRNPLKLRKLVIIDGLDKPAAYEDSKYQQFDGDKFIAGIKKFPIRVLTLTTISDMAVPPSDSQIGKPAVRELGRFRSDMVAQRRSSRPMRWFDVNQVDEETETRLREGNIQDILAVNGPGDRILGEIARANYPRENYEAQNVIEHDLDEQWSMGPNQTGAPISGETTAAEVKAMQSGRGVRLDYERAKVLRYIVDGSEILGDLIQLFATEEDYVEIVGPDGTRRLQPWSNRTIRGDYAFKARPDSALRVDVAQERSDAVRMYNLVRQDPLANGQKILERVLSLHGVDPATHMVTEQPKRGPEPPNVSYRFSGDDLNPSLAQFPIVITILQQAGIQIDANTIQAAQAISAGLVVSPPGGNPEHSAPPASPPHPGPAEKAPVLSKHVNDGEGRI